jgi:hypothetical protein
MFINKFELPTKAATLWYSCKSLIATARYLSSGCEPEIAYGQATGAPGYDKRDLGAARLRPFLKV